MPVGVQGSAPPSSARTRAGVSRFEFGLQAHQRGHQVGGGECRGAEISTDGGDLADRGIGGIAGGLGKRPAFRQGRKRSRQFGVRDAGPNSYLAIEDFHFPQFIDFEMAT